MSSFQRLTALLLISAWVSPSESGGAAPPQGEPMIALLSDAECWKKLPAAETGAGQPLPSWARALAGPMPRTTAALLRLDWVHRARSPLDPKIRAEMRLVAAQANHCAYAEAYAAADARLAGLSEAALDALRRGDLSGNSPGEKAALAFARKMTLDSASVTDGEFADLLRAHGEKPVVAMVLLLAYANFQDRLLLCLGSKLEPGEPRPPVEIAFATGSLNTKPGERPPSKPSLLPEPTGKDLIEDDTDWASVTYDELQSRLEAQRRRAPRIRIPTRGEVERVKPPGSNLGRTPSQWGLVCLGYQPEMAAAWGATMATFFAETKLDLTFEEGMFWITTRTINCSYCMGHVEMGWELAGLTSSDIVRRIRLLAGDDWSSFPPAEQRAYAFARKLTGVPWTVSADDIEGLKRDFGSDRAVVVIWAACRCNYMTRVSNGFQLRLERGNIFKDYFQEAKPGEKPGREQSAQ